MLGAILSGPGLIMLGALWFKKDAVVRWFQSLGGEGAGAGAQRPPPPQQQQQQQRRRQAAEEEEKKKQQMELSNRCSSPRYDITSHHIIVSCLPVQPASEPVSPANVGNPAAWASS